VFVKARLKPCRSHLILKAASAAEVLSNPTAGFSTLVRSVEMTKLWWYKEKWLSTSLRDDKPKKDIGNHLISFGTPLHASLSSPGKHL